MNEQTSIPTVTISDGVLCRVLKRRWKKVGPTVYREGELLRLQETDAARAVERGIVQLVTGDDV